MLQATINDNTYTVALPDGRIVIGDDPYILGLIRLRNYLTGDDNVEPIIVDLDLTDDSMGISTPDDPTRRSFQFDLQWELGREFPGREIVFTYHGTGHVQPDSIADAANEIIQRVWECWLDRVRQ